MLRIFSLTIVAALGSVAIAFSAVAIELADAQKLCIDYLENHISEPDWEKACFDAMQEIESQLPASTEKGTLQPRPTIPPALIARTQGPHAGDHEEILQSLRIGGSVEIIVEFNVGDIRAEANARAIDKKLQFLGADELEYNRVAFASVKEDGLAGLEGVAVLQDYDNLELSFIRVDSEAELEALVSRPEIIAVYENTVLEATLNESLSVIQQPAVAAMGLGGAGATIAILDTGLDYTAPPFNCTAPGTPAGCRVVATYEAAIEDSSLDDHPFLHGTNVSAIVAAVADDADLVVADVFDGSGAEFADIVEAIDWIVGLQGTLNIVAVNLSFGERFTYFTSPCTTNHFAAPMAAALAAGIQPIASTGNDAAFFNFFDDGIYPPACAPGVVSVGAVYDDILGHIFTSCEDLTASPDRVTCFSQSATFLSLLAPGTFITTATGTNLSGTSFSAPHVAGAWAVLSALAPPGVPNSQILSAMQVTGDVVADTRLVPARTTSRLNLLPEPGFGALLGIGTLGLAGFGRRRRMLARRSSDSLML